MDLEHLPDSREEHLEVLLLSNRDQVPIVRHGPQRHEHVKHPLIVAIALAHANDLLILLVQVVDASVVLPGRAFLGEVIPFVCGTAEQFLSQRHHPPRSVRPPPAACWSARLAL